ncbi:MAG: von Willebrand factor type [Myxococcaceae bacterium]|nr:von Willebrand factor type [Myxococcaceae bacterium]
MSLGLVCHAARLPELGAGTRDAFLLFDVTGQSAAPDHGPAAGERAPLCLAIAIDASSSMRGGRFALALQATRDVLASLGPQDRVAVITFDKSARVAVSPAPFDSAGADTARRALDRLTTGIGTNLGAGWREASEAVLRVVLPHAVRRVLLLTDGYPSRGETQRDALRARVMEGHARGVETSIVGLGDGIDDGLCVALAEAGEGRFHYLREESALPEIVTAEVEGARALVATEVSLEVQLTPRVDRAEVLHRYPCKPGDRSLDVRIGGVARDAARTVLMAVGLKEGTPDAMLGFATARGRMVRPAPSQPTAPGYDLGVRAAAAGLEDMEDSARVALVLPPGLGPESSRRRVAFELLVQRTLAEVRGAWDGLDRGDREAVSRRLERARGLRRLFVERGLVRDDELRHIPDVDAVERAMFSASAESKEERRRFSSWAHNTQLSFIGVIPDPKKR